MAPKTAAIPLCPGAYELLCDESGNWGMIGREARRVVHNERLAAIYGRMLEEAFDWMVHLHDRLRLCDRACESCAAAKALLGRRGDVPTARQDAPG